MKLRKGFIKKNIGKKTYLIPYGQRLHEEFNPLELNEIGAFIVDLLMTDISFEELQEKVCQYVEATTDEEKKQVSSDVKEYISYLDKNRILNNQSLMDFRKYVLCGKMHPFVQQAIVQSIYIADIAIDIYLDDERLVIDDYAMFERKVRRAADTHIFYILEEPSYPIGDRLILSNEDLDIYENEEGYTLCIKTFQWVKQVDISKDGRVAKIYHYNVTAIDRLKEELFGATKFVFFYMAMMQEKYAMHSASILYNDKVFLFTGPSGTGKSTHASLWNKILDCPILNGDVNVLEVIDDGERKVIVHGTPWCGTSNIFDADTRELGGIVRLYQAGENTAAVCDEMRAGLICFQRVISHGWTPEMMSQIVDFAEKLGGLTAVFELHCNMEEKAVYTIKKLIDETVFV